jgi:hypothetical protein
MVVAPTVSTNDPLAQRRCRTLGIPPAAIFEIEDRATGEMHAVKLAGSLDDLFDVQRRGGNKASPIDILMNETATPSSKETEP